MPAPWSVWLENWRWPPSNRTALLKATLVSHQLAMPDTPGFSADASVLFTVDSIAVPVDRAVYALVILAITGLLIVTSLLTIAIILTNDTLKDVIGYYLVSLAVSDLLCGTLVTPLSIYAAIDSKWGFGGDSSIICKVEAYVAILVWSSVVYMFMWIGVDRFAALNKPSRYDVEQTFTRCKCWIIFTWITSLLLSCPILAAEMEARYYGEVFLCVLDWGATLAYSITLAILVIVPSLVGVCYTYSRIFNAMRKPDQLEDTQRSMLETDQNYMMSFFVMLTFVVSWLPWFALRAYETIFRDELRIQPLHFSLMWLGVMGSVWKLLIYLIMNREFRKGLGNLWTSVCCCCRSRPSRERSEYQSLAAQRQRFL